MGGKDLILYLIGQIGVDGALYSAMEFHGEAIDDLSVEGRLTMANMAIEAGGKAGIFHVDKKTEEYVKPRAKRPYKVYDSDPDAEYAKLMNGTLQKSSRRFRCRTHRRMLNPSAKFSDVEIDQSVIGSCTNGRIEDLRIAARILKGKKVHPGVRCIVIPGTQQIYLDALKEGLMEIFIKQARL